MANVLSVTLQEATRGFEGAIAPQDESWATDVVDKAVRELVNKIKDLPVRVTDGTLDRDWVVDKIGEAAQRVFRNPEGMESETEGGYSYKLRTIMASGNIWYLDSDLLAMGYKSNADVPRTVYSQTSRGWGFPA